MDRARVWIVRVLAPIAFVAATIALVVIVQHALDNNSSGAGTTLANLTDTFEVTTEAAPSTEPTTASEPQYYRVKKGDTLESIAAKYGTTVAALTTLNNGLDPLALQPGQRIRVA